MVCIDVYIAVAYNKHLNAPKCLAYGNRLAELVIVHARIRKHQCHCKQ